MHWIKRMIHKQEYDNKLLNLKLLLDIVSQPITIPICRIDGESIKKKISILTMNKINTLAKFSIDII